MSAPASAESDANETLTRQLEDPTALTRYGDALPRVSAPTSTPSAKPRPTRNHVAITFIAGGYTPARNIPVRNRSAIAGAAECAFHARIALTAAPPNAQSAK